MSFSFIVLNIIIIALLLGAGNRLLDKMRMTDRGATLFLIAMVVALFIPDIHIGKYFVFNIGGFLFPIGLTIYLLVSCGFSRDLLRAILGSVLTAGLILLIQYLMPSETPEDIIINNVWLYGIVAGVVAYGLGRSRRNALICSVWGLTLSSIIQFSVNLAKGVPSVLALGTAGGLDSIIIASIISVGLAELIGFMAESVRVQKESKVFNFESGEFVDIEDINKNKVNITGLYKKMHLLKNNNKEGNKNEK